MSLNGLRISSPEQNSRQLPMDIVPSDQAAQIQIAKTLTPDMDADAIGGSDCAAGKALSDQQLVEIGGVCKQEVIASATLVQGAV